MKILAILALTLSVPATAQAPQSSPAAAAVAPARMALERKTIDFVWPLGTYARMMNGQMQEMMHSMMASSMDMKAADAVAMSGGKSADSSLGNKTMRELMAARDPHFEERFRILNRVMMEETVPLMTKMEPAVREGLAVAYARKFSEAQLADLNRFFATPSGAAYAAESMMLFIDPEVMSAMTGMMPEMIKAMPTIMAKVQAATAHLPPLPAEQPAE